jgi:hypothetical protein
MLSRMVFCTLLMVIHLCIAEDYKSFTATWVSGTNNEEDDGSFPSNYASFSLNNLPSARYDGASWSIGSIGYVFGGYEYNGWRNDLWAYDMNANTWAWLAGPSGTMGAGVYGVIGHMNASYVPRARQAPTSSVSENLKSLILFGGRDGTDLHNDLWLFNTSAAMWTWLGGFPNSTDICGDSLQAPARFWAHSTMIENTDEAIFYMFGGFGYAMGCTESAARADLWQYNFSSGIWSWTSGPSNPDSDSVHGNLGEYGPSFHPSSRGLGTFWSDGFDIFLFGGRHWFYGQGTVLNDLWRFNRTVNSWGWIAGYLSDGTSAGIWYGAKGISGNLSYPGARSDSSFWTWSESSVAIYGGYGFDSTLEMIGMLSDLWIYNFKQNEWTWIGGSSLANIGGRYDDPGKAVASLTNLPPGRQLPFNFHHQRSNKTQVFLFAGIKVNGYSLNDLWKFDYDSYCPEGMMNNNGACVSCGAGMFSSELNSSQCTSCPVGTRSSNTTGSSACIVCSGGFFTSTSSNQCTACAVGSYSFSNSSFCYECKDGEFMNITSQTFCYECSEGTYASRGASICTTCSKGRYNPYSRQSSCFVCDLGLVSSHPGMANCSECEMGTYSENSTTCTPCPSQSSTLAKRGTSIASCVCIEKFYGSPPSGNACLPCPSLGGVSCPQNSSTTFVGPGMFRLNGSLIALVCIPKEACKSTGYRNATICEIGYTGYLCGQCIAGSYYKTGSSCKLCPSSGLKVVIVIALVVVICYVVYRLSSAKQLTIPTEYKVLLFWIQLISTYDGSFRSWPNSVKRFLKFGSIFNIDFAIVSPGNLNILFLFLTTRRMLCR